MIILSTTHLEGVTHKATELQATQSFLSTYLHKLISLQVSLNGAFSLLNRSTDDYF